ncbi:hypothetical protein GCM10010349_30230 [Streptomyces flavofungini]|nr:hypothetical protein GCM10010349_30230 [Streptomyces flavofungini]
MAKHEKRSKSRELNLKVPLPHLPLWSFVPSSAFGVWTTQVEMDTTTVWAQTVLCSVAMVCETFRTVFRGRWA